MLHLALADMRVEADAVRRPRSAQERRALPRLVRRVLRWALGLAAAILLIILAAGLGFAGSTGRIPAGVTALGVELGGLTPTEAQAKLEAEAARYAEIPVQFTAAGKSFEVSPSSLDVRSDWSAVVEDARHAGDGPIPLRGLKRLRLRFFGYQPAVLAQAYDDGVVFKLSEIARSVEEPAREASIALRGTRPEIVPAQVGQKLDRQAARPLVLTALQSFERQPVALPVVVSRPTVTGSDLETALRDARMALSKPVRLTSGQTGWRIRPRRMATFLVLPADGAIELSIGGPQIEEFFGRLAERVKREPVDAELVVAEDGSVRVQAASDGIALDREATAAAVLAAALSPTERRADLVVATQPPGLTTEQAEGMGIERQLASYTTLYAGSSDRIRNLQLAVSMLDGVIIGPGETFSFNETVGPRTEDRGFRTAPVIVGDQYEEDVGGGVSQVATTMFNVAWEAGLPIVERHPHALYISRYQLGRDATVNYPNLDFRFRNDTNGSLLLKTGYDESGLSISILGPDTDRRVVSEAGELEEIGPPTEERTRDPDLPKGTEIIEEEGAPETRVTVIRTVYEGDAILRAETWTTQYKSESIVITVGTKPAEEPPPGEEDAETGSAPAAPVSADGSADEPNLQEMPIPGPEDPAEAEPATVAP